MKKRLLVLFAAALFVGCIQQQTKANKFKPKAKKTMLKSYLDGFIARIRTIWIIK